MKIIYLSIALVACALAQNSAEAKNYIQSSFNDNLRFYNGIQDEIVGSFMNTGAWPNSDHIARLLTFEHNLLSNVRMDLSLKDSLPHLLIADGDGEVRDFRFIPGQIIRMRAMKAGLDLRRDKVDRAAMARIKG